MYHTTVTATPIPHISTFFLFIENLPHQHLRLLAANTKYSSGVSFLGEAPWQLERSYSIITVL